MECDEPFITETVMKGLWYPTHSAIRLRNGWGTQVSYFVDAGFFVRWRASATRFALVPSPCPVLFTVF